jgi:hypothetical protein
MILKSLMKPSFGYVSPSTIDAAGVASLYGKVASGFLRRKRIVRSVVASTSLISLSSEAGPLA